MVRMFRSASQNINLFRTIYTLSIRRLRIKGFAGIEHYLLREDISNGKRTVNVLPLPNSL